MTTLTQKQIEGYYASQSGAANPLSPAEYASSLASPDISAPTPVDSTIASSPVRRYTGPTGTTYTPPTSGTYSSETSKLAALANTPPKDEATIRDEMRQRVQEQIDAIKNTYAGLISKENVAGQGRLGETRAIGARSGLLGSDFGAAQKEQTMGYNAEQVKARENERDVKISGILSKIDSEAYTRARDAIATADKNSKEYIDSLKNLQETARTDALTLAKSGADLNTLSDEQYKRLLDSTGYNEQQLNALFVTNKPQDKVLSAFTQGNQYIVVTQDPTTGERKTEKVNLGFEVPTDWKETKLDNGSILFYDSNDPTKQKIYQPAQTGGGETTAFSPEDKRIISQAGLSNADERVRAIFVNTPPAFREKFVQEGAGNMALTPEQLISSLEKWEAEQGGGANPAEQDDEDNPF